MSFVAENGQLVTDKMVDEWCRALDDDAWPEGWRNVGEIVEGGPSSLEDGTEAVSVTLPSPLKRAVDQKAAREGMTTSAYICSLLVGSLALDS